MLEIAKNLEQMAAGLNPRVLIGVGLAAVVIGLFIWLGGLGLRKVLAAVAGAVGGGIAGLLILGENLVPILVCTGVGCVLAVVLERVVITVLATALAAFFAFAILAGPYIGNTTNISDEIRKALPQIPINNWAVIAGVVIIVAVAGFYLWRLVSAFYCAALGTLLIFIGMILLLEYKGSEPVNLISQKPIFYGGVFVGMTAFGTVAQLLLCRVRREKPAPKKQPDTSDKSGEQPTKQHIDWRTS